MLFYVVVVYVVVSYTQRDGSTQVLDLIDQLMSQSPPLPESQQQVGPSSSS